MPPLYSYCCICGGHEFDPQNKPAKRTVLPLPRDSERRGEMIKIKETVAPMLRCPLVPPPRRASVRALNLSFGGNGGDKLNPVHIHVLEGVITPF